MMADFLSAQRAEVIAVSIFEYNEELKNRADSMNMVAGKVKRKAERTAEPFWNSGGFGRYTCCLTPNSSQS